MILDGRQLAEKIKKEIAREIKKTGLRPGLASILVGDNPASVLYISIKERAAKEIGVYFRKYHFENINEYRISNIEYRLLQLIKKLNIDPKIHGILVQLPLPIGFDTDKIIHAIDPKKDVDGFHPANAKLLEQGKPRFISPPHGAIIALLNEALKLSRRNLNNRKTGFRLKATIVANSKTFAEPLKILLERKGIKTQIFYNKLQATNPGRAEDSRQGRNYKLQALRKTDIIIVAKGKPKLITADMIKKGVIVIDVGTNRVGGKLVGDVDFASISKKAAWITPVPGGVGPMTVAMLLKNVFLAAKRAKKEYRTYNSKRSRLNGIF